MMIPEELSKIFSEVKTPIIFATCDNNKPHATPLNWWYYPGSGTLWVSPARGTRKIRNMRSNKNVCFATIDHMKKNSRGFICWGEIVSMETGVFAFLRHFRTLRKALVKHSEMYFDSRTLKFTKTYFRHPHIYYNFVPWMRYFVRVKIKRINYWVEDGEIKEVNL